MPREQLIAAKDNAQQIVNVIAQLSQLCQGNIEDTRERIRRAHREVGEAGAQLIRDQRETLADYADLGSIVEGETDVLRRQIQRSEDSAEADAYRKFMESMEKIQSEISAKIDLIQGSIVSEESAISVAAPSILDHPIARETVSQPCPFCDAATSFDLGDSPGDSAVPVCPNGHVFHAHRGRQGIFVRRPGPPGMPGSPSVPSLHVELTCPNEGCRQNIPINYPEGTSEKYVRWCFSCGSKCELDPAKKKILLLAKKEILRSASFEPLVCPRHETEAIPFYANSSRAIGICHDCDGLVEASLPK